MKLKVCEFCGTEYNSELSKCPLCGKSEVAEAPAEEVKSVAAAKPAKKVKNTKNPDKIPQWMWIVICSVLGVAVLIGLIYFLVSMGYVGKKEEVPNEPAQTVVAEPQPEEQPEEPEELVPEEPDLSCTGLTLSQSGIIMDEQGGHVFLTAVPTPLDCPDAIVFTSNDPSVATVDQAGMITAIAPGQTDIVVTCGGVTERCTIVCDFEVTEPEEIPDEEPPEETDEPTEPEEPEVLEPSLSSEDFTLFRPGEETTLTVKNAPDGANITYVSSDSSVATVTGTGLVTAVGSGTATITVTVNGTKLTCIARCNLGDTTENNGDTTEVSGPLALYNPYGNATDVMLFSAGESFNLDLVDASGSEVSGVSWSTSNSGVCTVDASGRVSASGGGTATVTATYNGQSYSCVVRCNF